MPLLWVTALPASGGQVEQAGAALDPEQPVLVLLINVDAGYGMYLSAELDELDELEKPPDDGLDEDELENPSDDEEELLELEDELCPRLEEELLLELDEFSASELLLLLELDDEKPSDEDEDDDEKPSDEDDEEEEEGIRHSFARAK